MFEGTSKVNWLYKYHTIPLPSVYPWLLVFTLMAGCNAYNAINTEYNRSHNFEQYQTFAWLSDLDKAGDSDFDNDFVRQKTKNYFGHCFKQRSIQPDTLNPDLLLQVQWLSETKEITLPEPSNFPDYYDPYYYQRSPALRFDGKEFETNYQYDTQDNQIEYVHGGVILSVIDRNSKKVIWKGVAEGDLYDPRIMYRDLHPAIHRLMRKFPIKPQIN